jgi:hypothetical protein
MFNKKWKIDPIKIAEIGQLKASFNFARTETAAERNLRKKRRSYLKERTKQKEHLNSQILHLEQILNDKSIDDDTYVRYKKLLEMNYEQEREETRDKHGFMNPMH